MHFFKQTSLLLVVCGALLLSRGAQAQTFVCVETNLGEFCMQMLETAAPNTVANFLKYVNDGDYDQTFIHRVVSGFVIQGGGYKLDPLGEEVPQDPAIANEFSLANTRGTVAMAKFANDPDSATSEWFVNLSDNSPNLDFTNGGYTVFATIVKGMDLVVAISNSLRVDLTDTLGDSFAEVPVLVKDSDGIGLDDLIQVKRMYVAQDVVTDTDIDNENQAAAQLVYQCTADWVAAAAPTQVCMTTNFGEMCMDLFPESAPLTVANFLHYVADGDYDNTIFHRSVSDFVIQGGGFKLSPLGFSVPADPAVVNEFSLSNTRGTVAMAKLGGAPDSATNQWFVNLTNNATTLDTENGGYTVFGQVNEAGMEVVDRIAALEKANLTYIADAFTDVPLQAINKPTGLSTADMVKVTRAWIPGLGANPCLTVKPEALAEYASRSFNVPVRVNDKIYQIYFSQDFTASGYVFKADLFKIVELKDKGQLTATFDTAAGILTIPSVLVNGQTVITDVKFRLTNPVLLEFTLDSYQSPTAP